MKELPQLRGASTKMGSDLSSKAYDLGSQLTEGQWKPSLCLLSVPVCFRGTESYFSSI